MRKALKIAWMLLLTGITARMVLPLIYMAMMSMTSNFTTTVSWDFSEYSFTNYERIFVSLDFVRYFLNSAAVVAGAILINVILGAMAGYGFAKKKFPGRNALYYGIILTMMIPGQVTLIPMYIIVSAMGLNNTHFILMLPVVNAFTVFLMTQSMMSIPDDLLEAARIDGANERITFINVVLPVARSAIVSLTIFTFITVWNDFLWPLVMVSDNHMRTMTLAVAMLRTNYGTNYGLMMAGATLVFVPPFIGYVLLQKRFVESIAMSGIKA